MNAPLNNTASTRNINKNLLAGIALVIIGLLILAGQMSEAYWFGQMLVPALALIFLAWGLVTREPGLLIPGGILGGIGAGALMIDGLSGGLPELTEGGLFLVIFGLGFASITLFSALIRKLMWWPLIPGAILAAIGGLLLAGEPGLQVLEMVGLGWPLVLVVIGLYLILKRKGMQQ